MNKKGLIVLGLALIFMFSLTSFAFAANETTSSESIDNAYKCLESQIQNKELSLKEATFSLLAIGSKGNLVDRVESEKDINSCWPKGACTIKESAQVALAYNRIGKDTSAVKGWLMSKTGAAGELRWLLEIDITNKLAASCTINDGIKENKIKILENSKIQGTPGSCLSIDSGGYMLRINANCLDKEFEISCDQDFISSILYQKTSGGTLFILPDTHSAASLGKTKEKVNGECFTIDKACDYEGSLWAAFALQKMGADISKFTPYLLALADDNERFFPSTFLYILAGGEDQYDSIVQKQKQGKFWEMAGTRDGRFYDTSLAMLALSSSGGAEIEATKEYLLGIQTSEGCWNNNNLRDTAFILYSGWPRTVAISGLNSPPSCEPIFSCENAFDCTQAGGTIEYNYDCSYAGTSCCSIHLQKASCDQKSGLLCSAGTECRGRIESSSDGPCCIEGACIETAVLEDTCTIAGGRCGTVCASDEVESAETCSISGETCCMAEKGSSLGFWITTLVILIILATLGIIFREKVKLWWFILREKMSARFGNKPAAVQRTTPTAPFSPMARPMMPQRYAMQPTAPIRPVAKDKEMEEALRKLREMSKK